jgi:hypothetical protein
MGRLGPPELDNRTYDQLVEELQARIPRYEPEWTDHNESDPGITLLQLFTYLVEAAVFAVVVSGAILVARAVLKRRRTCETKDRDAVPAPR